MSARAQRGSWLVAVLLGVLPGCVTNPEPFPLPIAPDTKAIFVSNPEQAEHAVTTGIAGAVSAPVAGDEIVLSTTPGGVEVRGPVFADGSFSLWIKLRSTDRLEARVDRGEAESARVEIPFRVETPNDAALTVTSVSAVVDGKTTVKGRFNAGQQVVVGNLKNGATAVAKVEGSGDFSGTLAAASGDKLSLFGLDPTTRRTSAAVEAAVP